MPNWIINDVKFRGTKEQIATVKDYVGDFDFNNITPRPATLDIISGSITSNASVFYLHHLIETKNEDSQLILSMYEKPESTKDEEYQRILKYFNTLPDGKNVDKEHPYGVESKDLSYLWTLPSARNRNSQEPKTKPDFLALGRIYWENIMQYGTADWYDWSIKNWGCKWNASEVECVEEDDIENKNWVVLEYFFQTPWSMPYPIFEKIYEKFKDSGIEIDWKFADEDIGSNCGEFLKRYDTQKISKLNMDNEEFACRLWGYEFDEDDEFDEDYIEDDSEEE